MNYELIKSEFIKLKKEELDYIDNVAKISSIKILSEYEKLEIYRILKNYEVKLNQIFTILCDKTIDETTENKQLTRENLNDVIIGFDLEKDYLSSLKFDNQQYILEKLGIETASFKYKLTRSDLIYNLGVYRGIDSDMILNKQKLIGDTIYIFTGYYDYSEDCYGPCLGKPDDYLYGIYEKIEAISNIYYPQKLEIQKSKMSTFEKDKIIIHSKRYVHSNEVKKIFDEELLNTQNKTINDCVIQTKNRVEELNYIRSPEYKEKILLERINELYEKVKGKFIKEEMLYNGNFLGILRETYELPNKKTVKKEKIVKNGGKNAVIVIAITQEKEYIITFQNRIKDKIIAEFPAGYIENGEEPIEAAIRELKEETGYISDDLFIVDKAYTSPGIDNSFTYIVVANNCIKTDEQDVNGTELINYGLFSEIELKYLINNNIMNGAMNKLAYYNLVNNVDDCNVTYMKSNKKIYKTLRKKDKSLK